MTLSRGMNYVPSIRHGEQLFTPAYARQASGAYYKDVGFTLTTTIMGWLQKGFEKGEMRFTRRISRNTICKKFKMEV